MWNCIFHGQGLNKLGLKVGNAQYQQKQIRKLQAVQSLQQHYVARQSVIIARAATAEAPAEAKPKLVEQKHIRNIAIVAHVDHGKTTLVDAMLSQCNVLRKADQNQTRIMDSNDLEKERGITILSKNTAITYKDTKINIIDTPGHADFGGEVERVLNMCDGVVLLVDSVDGPMPQTRFVVQKALELGKKAIVCVNKIDRPNARPDFVINSTFDLFCSLEAEDWQCDFPIVYASGLKGHAGLEPEDLKEDLTPLFDAILEHIPPPKVALEEPLQMMITNIDYDAYRGRTAIGRIHSGSLTAGQTVAIVADKNNSEGQTREGKVSYSFVFDNFAKKEVECIQAGDIGAINGLDDVAIGETVTCVSHPVPLPSIKIEEPTVRMMFMVNPSPLAGQEGSQVTSAALQQRLQMELERNVALQVERIQGDKFEVRGRGTLHIGILIENMRREGFELAVGPPRVMIKEDENGNKLEPYEETIIEVPPELEGMAIQTASERKGQYQDQEMAMGMVRLTFKMPTRGLIGMREKLLTASKGQAVIHTNFLEYGPFLGNFRKRQVGSLVATENGKVTAFAMENAQKRGKLFVNPGQPCYPNMIVGEHSREGDMKINIAKQKQLTNVRQANKEIAVPITPPKIMGVDEALEYVEDCEAVEITPTCVRLMKTDEWNSRGEKKERLNRKHGN